MTADQLIRRAAVDQFRDNCMSAAREAAKDISRATIVDIAKDLPSLIEAGDFKRHTDCGGGSSSHLGQLRAEMQAINLSTGAPARRQVAALAKAMLAEIAATEREIEDQRQMDTSQYWSAAE